MGGRGLGGGGARGERVWVDMRRVGTEGGLFGGWGRRVTGTGGGDFEDSDFRALLGACRLEGWKCVDVEDSGFGGGGAGCCRVAGLPGNIPAIILALSSLPAVFGPSRKILGTQEESGVESPPFEGSRFRFREPESVTTPSSSSAWTSFSVNRVEGTGNAQIERDFSSSTI